MEWWVWLIVVILFIFAFISSLWFAFSSLWMRAKLSKTHREQKWYTNLRQRDAIKLNQIDHLKNVDQPIILLMVAGKKWTFDDDFIPMKLIATHNFKEELIKFNQNIEQDHNLLQYLKYTNQTVDDLRFFVLEKIEDHKSIDKHLTHWKHIIKVNDKFFQKNA
ncbi:hypothetical protein [Williamsoniiplasma lucivorax]|uniref:Uncharacterized protein n=1 Tax=Williamsoniiplasma lucivorax TaxID=209274 RepID=A0A2S5REU1_9MOLU|nr:hypothetical protein [Williamsoniiplasma lucivorax]PPE05808.1 hypothetical protein ELUCI_v1c00960 [Williamsoniiplasma lucivorax]